MGKRSQNIKRKGAESPRKGENMNDERRKIKALKDDELLCLFCEICEGSYPIEDGATYTEEEMYAATREEILKRMSGARKGA